MKKKSKAFDRDNPHLGSGGYKQFELREEAGPVEKRLFHKLVHEFQAKRKGLIYLDVENIAYEYKIKKNTYS